MRTFTFALLLPAIWAVRAEAGGFNLQMASCTVDRVETDDDKVVFTVSGRCEFALFDPEKNPPVRIVAGHLEKCVITIPRKDIPAENVGGSWADYQKRAKALAGKNALMTLGGTITINERTEIAAMRCKWAQWAPAR